MHCISGKVFLNKTHRQVAYCGQTPCMSFIYVTFQFKQYTGLEHATVRDNIIYGSLRGWDEERYQAVIEACALRKDLEVFDAGDLTGEYI